MLVCCTSSIKDSWLASEPLSMILDVRKDGMATSGRIYFKGLNGIRAIAALSVVIAHTGQYLYLFGLQPSLYYQRHWQSYSVTLFFVLSGFLITYLLLEEKSRTATVSLKSFYLRRILRIWPLYYLIVSVTVVFSFLAPGLTIPEIPSTPLTLYAFLLANVASLTISVVTPLSPLWSIGVEEQFYALWPVIIKKSTNALWALVGVIAAYLAVKAAFALSGFQAINALIAETRIDCMAIGGIGAVILREKWKILPYLYSKTAQVICWGIFFYSCLAKPIHIKSSIDHELYAVLFVIILLNVSTNKNTMVNLEKPVFDFLGKISYGLYVYHVLVIFLLRFVMKPFVSESPAFYALVYAAVVAVTIATSYLSYRYFELPFLKVKDRFSVVMSQGASTPQAEPEVTLPSCKAAGYAGSEKRN
jgi:peptidoglycan/LPS O-acetylase OafA/YrhL